MTDQLQMGIYRHYKGPLYQVLGLAHDANAEDLYRPLPPAATFGIRTEYEPLPVRWVVVYMPLELDGAHLGPRMAVRTLEDFVAEVHVVDREQAKEDWTYETCPDTKTCVVPRGFHLHRFQHLGPVLTPRMLEQHEIGEPRCSERGAIGIRCRRPKGHSGKHRGEEDGVWSKWKGKHVEVGTVLEQ